MDFYSVPFEDFSKHRSYRDYVEPLAGGPLLRYPRLDTGKE